MPFIDISNSVILPVSKGDFISNWEDCLKQIKTQKRVNGFRVFKMNIFVHSEDKSDFLTKKEYINNSLLKFFGNECPTFGIIPASPEQQFNTVIEFGRVTASGVIIKFRKFENTGYTILDKDGYKELWVNGIEAVSNNSDTEASAKESFEIMNNILHGENMTFNNIIRQWNYIGSILSFTSDSHLSSQNYQIFNKVRYEYYSRFRSISGFPAATGVGMNYEGVIIDFCAISKNKVAKTFSVRNPIQINPYYYKQDVLSGIINTAGEQKQPPLFERAILLTDSNKWRLFVSGTASIIGQETVAIGNQCEQTIVTIENIRKLTSKENLMIYFPE